MVSQRPTKNILFSLKGEIQHKCLKTQRYKRWGKAMNGTLVLQKLSGEAIYIYQPKNSNMTGKPSMGSMGLQKI